MKSLLVDIGAFFLHIISGDPFNWCRTKIVIKKWRKRGVLIGEDCYINHDVVLEEGVRVGSGTTITLGAMVLAHDATAATFLTELRGTSPFNKIAKKK